MMNRRANWFFLALVFCMPVWIVAEDLPDLHELERLSEKGDVWAQTRLGECYFLGVGVDPDHGQAVRWLQKAAAENEPLARYNLAFMGFWGQDPGESYRDFGRVLSDVYPELRQLADAGDPRAQRALGTMLLYGLGVPPDVQAAVDSIKAAADQGDSRALSTLAMFYLNGVGVSQDDGKALEILQTLARQGQQSAEYQIASMLYSGRGMARDAEKAIQKARSSQRHNTIYASMKRDGDHILPGLLPPRYAMTIQEGSCGECCVWSLLNPGNTSGVTQMEINQAGGEPGRGLRSNELEVAMTRLGISYTHLSRAFRNSDEATAASEYRGFLQRILQGVRNGHPVIIGVKHYPTQFPGWPYDHFVLVVGTNDQTGEILFNDFQLRRRLKADTLINQRERGYSFVNDHGIVYALEITRD